MPSPIAQQLAARLAEPDPAQGKLVPPRCPVCRCGYLLVSDVLVVLPTSNLQQQRIGLPNQRQPVPSFIPCGVAVCGQCGLTTLHAVNAIFSKAQQPQAGAPAVQSPISNPQSPIANVESRRG